MFKLHPQLARDTLTLGQLPLCQVLLMNDARYPWLILVPRRPDLTDLHQVAGADSGVLWQEINQASTALQTVTNPFKLNVAALGNMVPQLHVHIIARYTDDAAWPGPVWGVGEAVAYQLEAQEKLSADLCAALNLN